MTGGSHPERVYAVPSMPPGFGIGTIQNARDDV